MDSDASTALPLDPPKSRRKGYRQTIREAILLNASQPESRRLTNKEIAKKLGVRVQSVWVALSNLRGEGVISPKEDKPAKDVVGPNAILDHGSIVERMIEARLGAPLEESAVAAAGDIMQRDERAKRLSQIARLAPSNVSVLAVKALDDQERGSGLSVGPPDPDSAEQRVPRLAKLMMACGRETVDAAVKLAWPDPTDSTVGLSSAAKESSVTE